MMDTDPAYQLLAVRPTKPFFIGIDSDGCAFDTMEIKHKECFIPNTIKHFDLQPIARYAREAAEFVNLYSQWRGINRFPALLRTLDLLAERPEIRARSAAIPRLPATRAWLEHEPKPANPALEAALRQTDGPAAVELQHVLEWSRDVNRTVAEMVRRIPPYPAVRTCLQRASGQADIMVVSATPGEALEREWREHNLAQYTVLIAGQELGTKTELLRLAAGGKYTAQHILMVGDAPGDLAAAKANGVLFFPVNPGAEAESWERLQAEALPRFFAGRYADEYEQALIADFEARLPDRPPWQPA